MALTWVAKGSSIEVDVWSMDAPGDTVATCVCPTSSCGASAGYGSRRSPAARTPRVTHTPFPKRPGGALLRAFQRSCPRERAFSVGKSCPRVVDSSAPGCHRVDMTVIHHSHMGLAPTRAGIRMVRGKNPPRFKGRFQWRKSGSMRRKTRM